MPTDATFPFTQDGTGDIATVSGEDFYRQHILQLGLIVATDQSGSAATANDAIELESAIRDKLTSSPYIGAPVRVSVSPVQNETVTAEIDVPETTTFDIPLEEPDQ